MARALVLTAALAVGLTGASALRSPPAGAQQVRLEAGRKAAAASITRRVLALRELASSTKSLVRLSEADRAALAALLQDQVNGLTSLNAKIQGDTDEAMLRADAQKIVTDYRVYVLTIPKARGVVVSDLELNGADRLTKLADRLSDMIDQASDKDTTKAKTDLAALRTKLASVTGTVSPLPAALLALQAAGYPGNHPTLEQTRASLRAARLGLADAATLARAVIADLK
jgi:hypothetical protein